MLFYSSDILRSNLYLDDSLKSLQYIGKKAALIYADPPYFLSNNGQTINSGNIVSVNKGDWDVGINYDYVYEFNQKWILNVKELLLPNGVIWISGTNHNTHIILRILIELNFKILNVIIWEKTNPPPNFYTKIFKQSYEYLIFARPNQKITHTFNHELLKKINNGKRFSDVWRISAVRKWEKQFGGHPTQKPISLLLRIILSTSNLDDLIIDPFTGSSTTGIASILTNRQFIGIDNSKKYLELSKSRIQFMETENGFLKVKNKFDEIRKLEELNLF